MNARILSITVDEIQKSTLTFDRNRDTIYVDKGEEAIL